jgi:hypothetical protein
MPCHYPEGKLGVDRMGGRVLNRDMKTINGFAVIAHKSYGPAKGDGFVIMGAKISQHSPSGYEYVTAVVDGPPDNDPEEWFSGHYFNSLDLAHRDYDAR